MDSIILRAAGIAISYVVPLAELIRRRIVGLHQNTEITTIDTVEVRKPREGGEEREFRNHMVMLKVTLTKVADQDFKDSAGYQAPLPEDEVEEFTTEAPIQNRGNGEGQGRGRGRGSGRGLRAGF